MSSPNGPVVVTGAAGFIGSHLCEALLATGAEVVGIDCFTDYYDPALKEENARGLDVRRLDLAADPIELAGFDGVFHLAGQPGVRSFGDVFPLYLERNVLATQRLFEAAVRDGVKVVFASSSSSRPPCCHALVGTAVSSTTAPPSSTRTWVLVPPTSIPTITGRPPEPRRIRMIRSTSFVSK